MRLLRLAGAAGVAFIVCANISLMGHLDGLALVMPSTLLNVGGLLMLVSLALWLRLVPINRIWGLVTPETRACARRWYDVNSHYGRQLFWWMFVVFLAGIAGFYQLPRYQLAYVWAAFPLLLVAIVAPAVSTRWWIRQQSAAAAGGKACWIVSQIGQGCVALVVVFFVRFFMVAPYRMEGGGEPGVANNSHWIALRLDTGF
jgi:hypothetical protein